MSFNDLAKIEAERRKAPKPNDPKSQSKSEDGRQSDSASDPAKE